LLQDVSKPHILVPEKIRLVGKAAQVASGSDFSLVLTEEGKLFSFGANQKGQLGVGHTRASSELCLVSLDGAKAVSFACGPQFAVVVTDKGSVFGWGSNGDEQLRGLERGVDQISPRRLDVRSSDDDPIVRVACGFAHVLALTRAGRVLAWGRNKNHQLGHTADSTIEVALFDGFVHKAVAIACGAEHSFVMTEMGRLFGFGR
jgi:X-linked retinitis pigmentosa GTPase regulator